MNWPLFCSTFMLIFLAELGDKTQLAVLSQSAASSSRWTVFAAGVTALAASTAIGVLAGGLLRKFVPDDRCIKIAGGMLFLLFGCLMLRDVFMPRGAAQVGGEKELSPASAWIGRFVIQQAAHFEKAAFEDYTVLAARAKNPKERAVFERLAQEEQWHHEAMLSALAVGADQDIPITEDMASDFPGHDDMLHDAAQVADAKEVSTAVEHAIEHELNMAHFYRTLSERSKIARLRTTFAALAVAEENHAKRLRTLLTAEEGQVAAHE